MDTTEDIDQFIAGIRKTLAECDTTVAKAKKLPASKKMTISQHLTIIDTKLDKLIELMVKA